MATDPVGEHFVGVDLAWGERQPTGVAALDARGALVHVSAQTDDASITAALAPYTTGACVVGIDAPLVVVNATGNRPAEKALNTDFHRFEAGAHPSNTGKAEFAGVPRGARLATSLDLDMDPHSRAPRRALEVYPHAATVALFDLERTLKYKNKPGRPFAGLRDELLRLARLLEGLRDAPLPLLLDDHDPWHNLVAGVQEASRKSELRRVEDQVDAVVCAYVAMFAARRPELTTTYGDLATGYIITPTLPHLLPAPVTEPAHQPGHQDVVRRAVRTFADRQPELRVATDRFLGLVTTLLDEAGINYLSVTGRAKTVASFAAKAAREVEGVPVYADPLTEITDQVGVRVITYLHSDVSAVADVLGDQLTVLDDRDLGQETANQGRFGYASRHLLVSLPVAEPGTAAEDPVGDAVEVVERPAQVQVRTVLQHAWAEFEHAIRYKGSIPAADAPDLDRRFTLAAGLLELADREFTLIRDRLQESVPDRRERGTTSDVDDPRIAGQDLADFLGARFADAGWSRADHYTWVSGLLLELGVTSLDELGDLLSRVDAAALDARMAYRYPPGAVRRLDDALLAVFGERYVTLHGNTHREALLRARLEKLRSEG